MSNKIHALTVVLDGDYSEEQTEKIISSILMIRGVGRVAQIESASDDWYARERIAIDLQRKCHEAINKIFDGKA